MCSGITCGRVLNGELYVQRFEKLIYLYIFTDYFMTISPQSLEQTLQNDQNRVCFVDSGEIFKKESVNKCR